MGGFRPETNVELGAGVCALSNFLWMSVNHPGALGKTNLGGDASDGGDAQGNRVK